MDALLKALDWLIMNTDSGDPKSRSWRTIVGLFVLLTAVFIVWACGGMTGVGLGGFAYADGVEKLASQIKKDHEETTGELKRARVTALENAIVELQKEYCRATTKQYFWSRRQDLLMQYRELQGFKFDPPSCDDLK